MGIETALFAAAAGTVAQAYGQNQVGKTQQAAYNFNGQIDERNAKAADQQAEQIQLAADLEAIKFRNDFQRLQDATAQANRYNGWMADTGTPLKVALANAPEAEEELAIAAYNASIGAAQARESAVQSRMSSQLNQMYGRAARRAGAINAGSSLLAGASNIGYIRATA